MRIRVVEGIKPTFRSTETTANVTRRMLKNSAYLDEQLKYNFAFLKSLPYSVQYWGNRKLDVFAMIHQLGKPTLF